MTFRGCTILAPSKAGYVYPASNVLDSGGVNLKDTVQIENNSPWKDTINYAEFQWRAVDVECTFAYKQDWNRT